MIIPHPPIPPILSLPLTPVPTTETIHSAYGADSTYFIALHPFFRTIPGHEQFLFFGNYYNRPRKSAILEHCTKMSWTEFISIAGLADISSLARSILFGERGRRYVERTEYLRMSDVLQQRPDIMMPPVDWIPEQWENDLGHYLLSRGQLSLQHDLQGLLPRTIETQLLLGEDRMLISPFNRISTVDNALSMYQQSDEPYTIFFGHHDLLIALIEAVDLEGFFANAFSSLAWSDAPISPA